MALRYANMVAGIFLSRPNRFIAHVEIQGQTQVVHVKNTGRCRELLIPGTQVWCQQTDNPARKTKYDLIAVRKGERLINMDSQAPNVAAREWLAAGGLGAIENLRPETVHGDSRFDFSFTLAEKPCFLEVKGVTLEEDGICAFPDAPTIRGAKHLRGLAEAARQGYGAYGLFVIQMENVRFLHPNDRTDPDFGAALREAAAGHQPDPARAPGQLTAVDAGGVHLDQHLARLRHGDGKTSLVEDLGRSVAVEEGGAHRGHGGSLRGSGRVEAGPWAGPVLHANRLTGGTLPLGLK